MATNSSPIPPSQFYTSTDTRKKPTEESMPQPMPNKKSAASCAVYTSNHIYHDPALVRAAGEMAGNYEEISPDTLLDMLDDIPGMPALDYAPLKDVAKLESEPAMYDPFIVAMTSYLKKGWTLVETSNHADLSTAGLFSESGVKPDIGLYASNRDGKSVTKASEAELFGEFKLATEDEPFRLAALNSKGKGMPLEVETLRAQDTRGQIALYINAIQATQQRTRVFAFYIRANLCRLLCHSRAGTRVTSPFDYTKDPYLHQFFWRLSHTPPGGRGHDTTFMLIEVETQDAEAEMARAELGILSTGPLYKVSVDNQVFYVSQPFTHTHVYPVGRGTRCFSAYDPVGKRVVLLKDTWRITDYQAEHLTYKKLHEHSVRNIPGVIAAGAVQGKFHNTAMQGRNHEHYRIVLDVVGKPLYAFTSSHQFIMALFCAFRAHQDAWERAGILHRDISIGNIIIVQGKGMLIDWERAKSKDDTGSRALERTGTWQFMSTRILEGIDVVHEVRDDIESFVHVALWTSARYIPNDMTVAARTVFLATFDFHPLGSAEQKLWLLAAGRITATRIKLKSPVFAKLMGDLMQSMGYLHNSSFIELIKDHSKKVVDEAEYEGRMLTHNWMANKLETALHQETWKATMDGAVDHELAGPAEVASNGKRKKDHWDVYRVAVKKQRVNEGDSEDSYEMNP